MSSELFILFPLPNIPREKALKYIVRTQSKRRAVFAVTFDPMQPNIHAILQKHWRVMDSMDLNLAEVLLEPPLTAYKRQQNIQDLTIRAKVAPKATRKQRRLNGMKKCQKECLACPYIKEGKNIKYGNFTWNIRSPVNCETSNIVYMVECKKDQCGQRYIGESKRTLKERFQEHKGYINKIFPTQATGVHFNLPGHNLSDATFTILEKVKKEDELYRKERESFHIRKFNTYYKGINRMP